MFELGIITKVDIEIDPEIREFQKIPGTFETARDAAQWAKERKDALHRFKVFPVDVESWKQREQARLDSGDYLPCVWASQDWFTSNRATHDHFVHLSKKQDGLIAYTESIAKGVRDVQTAIRPGAYLEAFFP